MIVCYLPVIVSPSGFHVAVNFVIGLVDGGCGLYLWCLGSIGPVHTFFGAPSGYPLIWIVNKNTERMMKWNITIVWR